MKSKQIGQNQKTLMSVWVIFDHYCQHNFLWITIFMLDNNFRFTRGESNVVKF